jgi:RNA polymerase sigma factor (sigma-70 family)
MQLRVPRPYGAFTPVPLLQDTNENFDPNMGLAGEGIRVADEPLATQLRHVANGDSAAFWRLWEEHEKYLYRICLHQLGGVQEEAEDALGVLMVKLLEQLPRYADRIQNLKAWLTRITYNLCIDIRRERNRTWNLENVDELTATGSPALLSSSESPEEATLRRERRRYIDRAIDDLALKLRVPFLLHHLYDLPYNKIATRLAISPENARKRGQLARSILQDRLKQDLAGSTRPAQQCEKSDWDVCLRPYMVAEQVANSVFEKIPAETVAVRLVNVVLNSGVERSFYIHLDHPPLKLYPKIERVTRYTGDHPSGWKKRLELAQLLYEAGQWKGAIQEYRRVLEKQPGLIHVYVALGNVLDLIEDELASIAAYQQALAIAQEPATRHHISGLIEIRRRNYQRAISEFEVATQIEPDHAVHWHHLAIVYLLEDSPLEALGCFEESLKINPNDVAALTHLPYLLLDLGRMGEAERCLDRVLRLHPANVLSVKCLADCRSRRRWVFGSEGKKTLGMIRVALRLAPESPEIQDLLASYHLCRGEWKEGIALMRTFTEQHRSCPEGWTYYANILFRTGDSRAAAEAVKRACRLDVHSWEANSTACEILSWQDPTSELRQLLEKMLETFPGRWRMWVEVGFAWIRGFKDGERAAAISARAPQLRPRLADAWFQHSQVLTLSGRYHEAIMSAEVGWKWLPDGEDGSQSVPAAFGLAKNYIFINAMGRGLPWISEAERRLPDLIAFRPAEGNFWQGKLLELTGDKRGALQAFRKSLELNLFYPIRHEAETAISRLTSPLSKRARTFPVK